MSVAVLSFTAFAFSQVGTPGPANMAMMAAGARMVSCCTTLCRGCFAWKTANYLADWLWNDGISS